VYTPPTQRQHGYGSAVVHALTQSLLAAGLKPILNTDLSNPTSNGIYRTIGYRAIDEALRYEFDV
jgi:predicted GNAT family acetyltransferase